MGDTAGPPPGHLVVRLPCAACRRTASSIELVRPGERPVDWEKWSPKEQELFEQYREPDTWRLLFKGIVGENGLGDDITPEEAARYAAAFAEPLRYENIRQAGLYDDAGVCAQCRRPYCYKHWNVSAGGYGHCPRGHGRSLDPHWSPGDYE